MDLLVRFASFYECSVDYLLGRVDEPTADLLVPGDPSIAFGRRLRKARESLGLSQPELAERAGVTAAEIGAWEDGLSKADRHERELLADACEVTVAWLVGLTDDHELPNSEPRGPRLYPVLPNTEWLINRDLLRERLTALRTGRGLSHDDLAREVGTSRHSISAYERGEAQDCPDLKALADFFGVSSDYLAGWADDPAKTLEPKERRSNWLHTALDVLRRFWKDEGDDVVVFVKGRQRKLSPEHQRLLLKMLEAMEEPGKDKES
jgi:transcriptional regulator with XRE-family HTH domain